MESQSAFGNIEEYKVAVVLKHQTRKVTAKRYVSQSCFTWPPSAVHWSAQNCLNLTLCRRIISHMLNYTSQLLCLSLEEKMIAYNCVFKRPRQYSCICVFWNKYLKICRGRGSCLCSEFYTKIMQVF